MEALLGYEMVQVACGASHVLALSTERELFAWGRGDGGKLPTPFQPLGFVSRHPGHDLFPFIPTFHPMTPSPSFLFNSIHSLIYKT